MRRPALTLVFTAIGALVSVSSGCPAGAGPGASPGEKLPGTPPDPEPELCTDTVPGPYSVRLLTRAEYDRTLRDLLDDTTAPARAGFPSEAGLTGYENDGDAHRASPLLVELYLRTAEAVAARALAERRALIVPCDPAQIGEQSCGAVALDVLGPRAFRRPLLADERSRLLGVFDAALPRWGFDTAIALMVQTVLISPQFLYRVDLGASAGQDGAALLAGPYEMASRLSYLLWGSMPDAPLFEAAASGALLDVAEVELQARRMLEDPRAQDGTASFFRQWLTLDKLDGVQKDTSLFDAPTEPTWTIAMNDSWKAAAAAFVDDVLWNGTGTLEELFTSEALFVDALTAPLYGFQPPGVSEGLVRRMAPGGTRAGLLTQPAMMAMLAGADQSSPIRRGVWVRENLLCQPIDPPPPNVVIEPPPANPNLTTRERFAAHTEDESCRSCHELIDPIGFGFERYDAVGRYRDNENGLPIDDSGTLAYTGEPTIEGDFVGARQLGLKLAHSATVQACLIDQVFTFAIGRVPGADDACSRDHLFRALETSGDLKELIVAIATSDAMRTVRGEP